MFQVEPILWLQSHSTPALTWLMSAITLLGYAPAYAAAVLALAFGLRLRPGLGVLLTLLVSAILTEGLKTGLALPRPYHVDARVVPLGFVPAVSTAAGVTRGGAASFWSLPAPEAITAVRSRPGADYGFPSGHASAAVAFVLATGFFFGSRRVAIAGLLWPLVMALSRIYLGRHFLGDVLGGIALGCLAFVAAALLLRGFDASPRGQRWPVQLLPVAPVAGLLACLLPFLPLLDPENVGLLAGFVVACGVLLVLGLPPDHATLPRRCGRVAAAALVLVASARGTATLLDAGGSGGQWLGKMVAAALVIALTLLGGVAIARRLGWYSRR